MTGKKKSNKGYYGRSRSRRAVIKGLLVGLLAIGLLMAAGIYGIYNVVTEPPDRFQRAIYPIAYEATILEASEAYDMEPTFMAAVIYAESRYDPEAVSPQNAQGLMQITPDTADFIQRNSGITGDFTEPETNIWMGTWQLSYLQGRYLGDERLMLAAYNSGQGSVDGWISEEGFDIESDIPYSETRNYVDTVLEARGTYEGLYGRNLDRNP